MAGTKPVEAVFPLTPMQQGLLVYSLRAAGGDPGLLHLRCDLAGPLDPDRFRGAWAQAARRHPVLRTVLRWEGLDAPLQIVLRDGAPSLDVEDLRALRPVEQQQRIGAALAADRERGLDLSKAPTSRLHLFRTGPGSAHLVWTCHHVLLDGWSSALVLGDAVALCNASHAGVPAALSPAPPFRDYVRWLGAQDDAASEAYWRRYLAGQSAPTPLPFEAPAPDAESTGSALSDAEQQDAELPPQASDALRGVARRLGVTVGTILQGAWALLLSRSSDHETVVFDVTTSGRSVDLPGVEAMAGMLINALPVRACVDPASTAADVIRRLHDEHVAWVPHAHSAPAQVHAWSEVPAHLRLSESLLVVENYPHETEGGGPLRYRGLDSGITSSYPLTVVASPGETVRLHLLYDGQRFAPSAMTRLLYRFQSLLGEIAADPNRTVGALLPEKAPGAPTVPVGAPPPAGRDLAGVYLMPRDEVERRLVAIWEGVLNVRPVGVGDGFFELGGQSVQAVRLLSQVERAFKTGLPMSLLFGGTTPARMAEVLRGEVSAPGQSLVPLTPAGTHPPLYCVHSYDGEALVYHRLAQHLGPDQPVYGLQAVGIDGESEPLTDIHEMAARYVAEIRAVQPRGPYALAAICFGIAVALEMGRILMEAEEEVAHLLVFDSSFSTVREGETPTQAPARPPAPRGSWPVRILRRLARPETLRELPTHLAVHGRKVLVSVRQVAARRQEAAERRARERAGARELRQWQALAANQAAWDGYRPTPYAGPVTLFRSSAWSSWGAKWWHVPVWEELAGGGLTVRSVPGNHETMLYEPYVQALAAQVRACLDPAAAVESAAASSI